MLFLFFFFKFCIINTVSFSRTMQYHVVLIILYSLMYINLTRYLTRRVKNTLPTSRVGFFLREESNSIKQFRKLMRSSELNTCIHLNRSLAFIHNRISRTSFTANVVFPKRVLRPSVLFRIFPLVFFSFFSSLRVCFFY